MVQTSASLSFPSLAAKVWVLPQACKSLYRRIILRAIKKCVYIYIYIYIYIYKFTINR